MRSVTRKLAPRRAPAAVDFQPLEDRRLFALSDGFGTTFGDGNDAVATSSAIHRVWRNTFTGQLNYASRSRSLVWSPVTVIDTRKVGGEMSVAVDAAGRPGVAYYDRTARDLHFAQLQGNTWKAVRLDFSGDVGDYASLVFVGNKPFISYYDRSHGNIKLMWRTDSGRWLNQVVESAGDVGAYNSLAVAPDGRLRIAYSDVSGMRLKYASQNGDGSWFVRTLDKTATAGVRFTSLVIDQRNGQPYVGYYDVAKKDLRVATTINNTQVWGVQRVATSGVQGEFANLFIQDGQLNVVYMNRTLGTVNHATLNGGTWKYTTLAMGGEHLSVARSTDGASYFNFYDTRSGALRTSTPSFRHTPTLEAGDRIIHWETIGFSSGIAADHHVGWSLKQNGWKGYVRDRVGHLLGLGMKRLLLHNPFGVKPGAPYFQFDQYLDAQAAGLTWLTNDFVTAFKPLTAAGVEVICYIGKIFGDPDFEQLTDFEAYMDRVMRSIKPMLDAGCSIGLDSIVGADNNTRAFMVANALRASGVKVYAENRPPRSASYWHDFGGVYYNRGFIADNPANNPSMHWAATNEMLKGDVIRYTAVPPPGFTSTQPGWRIPEIVNILRDGHTAATDLTALVYDHVTMQQVMQLAGGAGVSSRPPGGAPSESVFSSTRIDDVKEEVIA